MSGRRLTRRQFAGAAAAAGASTWLGAAGAGRALGGLARPPVVDLPSPRQVRRSFQRMVDFGPRLTASPEHHDYVDWLEDGFRRAGLDILPRVTYPTDRWLERDFGLEILSGPSKGSVPVATYYPRSEATPPGGLEGPLVYGGALPAPSLNLGAGLSELRAALDAYPEQLASWANALPGTVGGLEGSVLLVDLPIPVPLTAAIFLPLVTSLYWPGHTLVDWGLSDYKRVWILPGLGIPLAPFAGLGAAGVVFITDASRAALKGGYLPFLHGFEDIPALYVDRAVGTRLRQRAAARPNARLTLTASRREAQAPSITAVLPGRSREMIIFSTHTDGQNFVEENGGVAFLHLARHFASLPPDRRPRRTIVFAAWPGHMVADVPQAEGWIEAHPDLVDHAAAALTIEHLGCSEWADTPAKGYHPTGRPEIFGLWTTQGKMFTLARDSVRRHRLARTALLRPPIQFGVGAPFQSAGVPQVGGLAGPQYLLTISDNGELDKLDEELAARQIRWLADLAQQIDPVPRAELRRGDPTLGLPSPIG